MEILTTLENTYVGFENGAFATHTETISAHAAPGQVLVKAVYTTCNPYDHHMHDAMQVEGYRLGCEGCGTIVSVGEGVDPSLLNQKMAFNSRGTWAQYLSFDAKTGYLIFLEDGTDLRMAAAACVNPLTAVGQLDTILLCQIISCLSKFDRV